MLFYLPNGWGSCQPFQLLQCTVHNVSLSSLIFACCRLLPPAASRLSLCQVRSHGLMEAFCFVIGGSIRHSALGTLAALIRSLGLLTSQGRMLQQNTDQMTVPCFVGTCKGGGRRQRKSICLVSAAPEAFSLPVWCLCVAPASSQVQQCASLFICGVKCQRGARLLVG